MTETVWIRGNYQRDYAKRLIDGAPLNSVVKIGPPKRTLDQNAKCWAMLSDIAKAKPMGRELEPEIWKTLFMHQLGQEMRFEASLDGKGVVPINYRSSALTKAEFGDLFILLEQFAVEHSITFTHEGN